MSNIDNMVVYQAIYDAITKLGLEHEGGSDVVVHGQEAIENVYSNGEYRVAITMQN